MGRKGTAPHRGNGDGAISQKLAALGRSGDIVTDYARGSLLAGLMTAVSVGACMILEVVL